MKQCHEKESYNAFSQLEINQLTNQPTNQPDETLQPDQNWFITNWVNLDDKIMDICKLDYGFLLFQ